jgi:O-antigen/teichoic acid export membrane protein
LQSVPGVRIRDLGAVQGGLAFRERRYHWGRQTTRLAYHGRMASDPAAPADSPPQGQDLLDTPLAGPAAVRGGAVRAVGYLVGVVLSVGSAALLFRHLGVDDTGRYVTALSLVTIAGGLSDLGLTAIAIRELAVRDGDARARLVSNILGLRTALTVVGIVAMTAFAATADYPSAVVWGTALAGIGLIVLNVQGTLSASLTVQLKLGWVTAAELLRQVVTVFGIVVLVVAGAALLPFFAVQIPAAMAALALTVVLVRGEVPLRPTFDWDEWRALLREVLPFAAAAMLGIIYFRLAIVILSLTSTSEETGYFSASFRVIEVLVVIPQLLISGAFPIFARAARDDRTRLAYGVQRTFEASLVVGVGSGLVLVLGAPFAIDVVAGPDFAPSIGILRIQAVALVVTFVHVAWVYALLSLHRYRAILLLSISGVILNAVTVGIFGSMYGAKGAAWATAAVDVFQTVLIGVALATVGRELRPSLARLPKVCAAAAAGGAVALIPLPSVAQAALGGLIFLTVALVLRAIPEEAVVEARKATGSLVAAVRSRGVESG